MIKRVTCADRAEPHLPFHASISTSFELVGTIERFGMFYYQWSYPRLSDTIVPNASSTIGLHNSLH